MREPPFMHPQKEARAIEDLGEGWVYQVKVDGIRLWWNGQGHLFTRAGNEVGAWFPEVLGALVGRRERLDIEVSGPLHKGLHLAQSRLAGSPRDAFLGPKLHWYVLDYPDSDEPADERLADGTSMRCTSFKEAKARLSSYARMLGELGLEGLVAKRADSKYTEGRSDEWIKLKSSSYSP